MKINKPHFQNIYYKLRKIRWSRIFSDPYFPVWGHNLWSHFPRADYKVQIPLYL